MVFFVYVSLHYSYSALPLFSTEPFLFSRQVSQSGVKIVGFGAILGIIGLMAWQGRGQLWPTIVGGRRNRPVLLAVVAWYASSLLSVGTAFYSGGHAVTVVGTKCRVRAA